MYKKLIYLTLVVTLFLTMNIATLSGNAKSSGTKFSDVTSEYSWAVEAINELVESGAISGVDKNHFEPESSVTKEQFAKMLVGALDIELPDEAVDTEETTDDIVNEEKKETITYDDVDSKRWSYDYIVAVDEFFYDDSKNAFNPEEHYTREKCAYAISMALGFGGKNSNLLDAKVLDSFKDSKDITEALKNSVAMVVERGIVKGNENRIRPKGEVTRAEAAVLLYRAKQYKERNSQNLFITETPMLGKSTVTLEQAKKWATEKGAHERFINVADYYWKYGEITGIRPEILYGQAAKETGFGKYTGQVKPEQNNWAGIKIKNPVADRPEDHETFETPEDGVRAHFNHISAYVGTDPVGEPHDRYYVLKTVAWRGTVKNVEQLGGKWAPDVTYGYNIVVKMLRGMENTK